VTADRFLPLWNSIKSEPFKRTPFPTSSYEIAIGAGDRVLLESVADSAKAFNLLKTLREFVKLRSDRTAVDGLWLQPHELWSDRSRVPRAAFSMFWERDVAPFIIEFNRRKREAS